MFRFLLMLADGPLPDIDPSAAGHALERGISSQGIVLICAGAGLVLMWILRLTLLPNLKGQALAWTSTILIALASGATVLTVTPTGWMNAIGAAITAGLAAAKAWDLLPKSLKAAAKKPIKKRQR